MQIDLDLFKRIIHERHNTDILDSYSVNQFRTKEAIIEHVEMLNAKIDEIVIMDSWYGSIFIFSYKHVNKITLIDKDKEVINTVQIDCSMIIKMFNLDVRIYLMI